MKYIASLCVSIGLIYTPAWGQELPPANAKPGECYAKVLIPAVYENKPEQVVTKAASTSFRKIPAIFSEEEKQILVEEESYKLVTVPAVYEIMTEQVLIQPQQTVKSVVPATYREEAKRVLISPARVEWKAGRGAYEKIDAATGEIMCRVEIPAVYKSVTQKVIDAPAQTSEELIPAKYITIERKVMKTPPSTRKEVIPAKYRTVNVKKLVQPEKFEVIENPALFSTVEKRRLVSKEAVQWRQILCETNTTTQMVLSIQKALQAAGFPLGFSPDGEFGPATQSAIRKYQLAKGLPTGGLTISTIKSLGVQIGS